MVLILYTFYVKNIRKKCWWLTGLLLLCLFPALAQKVEIPKNEAYSFPATCYYVTGKGHNKLSKDAAFFSSLVIIDARADTAKLGYYYDKKDQRKKIICPVTPISDFFPESISDSLYLNNQNNDGKIYGFVKNIWINNISMPEKIFKKGDDYTLWLKAEYYYMKEEKFWPLYRFDSMFIANINRTNKIEDFITVSFAESLKKLSKSIATDFTSKKWITRQQIDSFNTKNRQLPIFNEPIKKGIFLSVDELRNNRPSFTSFSASFSENADMLYVKGININDSAITDAFAFSDGKDVFIKQKANFFQLQQKGTNFEFYGFNNISVSQLTTPGSSGSGNAARNAIELGVTGLLSQINMKRKELQLRILDIDTGKYY